jgi:pyruvate,water dikinase
MPFIIGQLKRLSQSGETSDTIAQLKHVLEGLQNTDICLLDNQALYEYIWRSVDNAIQWTYMRFRIYVFPMIFLGFSINRTIRKAKFSKPVNQYDFLAGLDYKTAEIEHALYSLAKELDEDTGVRQLFLEKESREILPILKEKYAVYFTKIAGFLKEYGARTMKVNIPFSAQSWSERPELLMDTLKTILKAGNLREHIEQQKNSGKKYADLKNAVSGNLTPKKREGFERLLEQFRSAHTGREALIYYIEQSYVAARHGVAEAAERLCGAASGEGCAPGAG